MMNGGDDDREPYQAVSLHAVLSLTCGLAGPLTFVGPLGWLAPWAGIILAAAALRRIARNAPHLAGRKAALAGLTLSAIFAAAGPVEWIVYRQRVAAEAVQFAQFWFDFLRDDQPQKAFQLTLHPHQRQPLDASLWEFYTQEPRWRHELDDYVTQPAVRTLLALGPRAEVRFCQIDAQDRERDHDLVSPLFAVTFDEAGRKKTYFIRLKLERMRLTTRDAQKRTVAFADWRVVMIEGGVRPAGSVPERDSTTLRNAA